MQGEQVGDVLRGGCRQWTGWWQWKLKCDGQGSGCQGAQTGLAVKNGVGGWENDARCDASCRFSVLWVTPKFPYSLSLDGIVAWA
jgi:hypothetical protein